MKRIIFWIFGCALVISLGVKTQPVKAQETSCGNRITAIIDNGIPLPGKSGLSITVEFDKNVKKLLVFGGIELGYNDNGAFRKGCF
jgi:hypothetical protein